MRPLCVFCHHVSWRPSHIFLQNKGIIQERQREVRDCLKKLDLDEKVQSVLEVQSKLHEGLNMEDVTRFTKHLCGLFSGPENVMLHEGVLARVGVDVLTSILDDGIDVLAGLLSLDPPLADHLGGTLVNVMETAKLEYRRMPELKDWRAIADLKQAQHKMIDKTPVSLRGDDPEMAALVGLVSAFKQCSLTSAATADQKKAKKEVETFITTFLQEELKYLKHEVEQAVVTARALLEPGWRSELTENAPWATLTSTAKATVLAKGMGAKNAAAWKHLSQACNRDHVQREKPHRCKPEMKMQVGVALESTKLGVWPLCARSSWVWSAQFYSSDQNKRAILNDRLGKPYGWLTSPLIDFERVGVVVSYLSNPPHSCSPLPVLVLPRLIRQQ